MAFDFYKKSGKPIAYTADDQHIYLFSGRPVAYLAGNAVYAFSGRHLGWFENGWVRDTAGRCVFFTTTATGGPTKPVRNVKSVKGVKPIKGVKQVKSVKAMKSLSWSPLFGEQFFQWRPNQTF